MGRQYIKVIAEFDECGKILPKVIVWKDGRRFGIDSVVDMRMCAATKAGGQGMRYTCMMMGRRIYIFRDRNRWFMETDENGKNTGSPCL